jgi:carbon monoxide dehydrogenase subunit G
LLPDFQGMTQRDATHFIVTVKVAIANMSGNIDMNMELTEAQRPLRAQYAGTGSVAGTNVALTAGFNLLPAGTGTKVAWQGETEMSGGLAAMAIPLLEPAAKKNVMKLIDGLQFALQQKR